MSAPEFDSKPLPEQRCPHCSERVNRVGDPSLPLTPQPKPGDVGLCFRCTGFWKLGPALELQLLTRTEFVRLELQVQGQLIEGRHRIIAFRRQGAGS